MSRTTLPCGCQHDERAWLQLCEPHGKEAAELHERAAREHRQTSEPVNPEDWLNDSV